jgi:predicted nucleic acid-binding protein
VSNTSPVIYLAKIEKLNILKRLYGMVYLPSQVWSDIAHLARRRILAPKEFETIEQAKDFGWITIKDVAKPSAVALREELIGRGLGSGEANSIALAKELGLLFLANDRQAILLATEWSVETRWLTEILHDALKVGVIGSLREFTSLLDACIAKGLYLSRRQRERAIQKATENSQLGG